MGKRQAPDWLAWEEVPAEHGRTLHGTRRRYGRFLREGLAGNVRNPLADAVASTVLGSPSFVEQMRKWIGGPSDRDVSATRRLRNVLSLDNVALQSQTPSAWPSMRSASAVAMETRQGRWRSVSAES